MVPKGAQFRRSLEEVTDDAIDAISYMEQFTGINFTTKKLGSAVGLLIFSFFLFLDLSFHQHYFDGALENWGHIDFSIRAGSKHTISHEVIHQVSLFQAFSLNLFPPYSTPPVIEYDLFLSI